MMRPETFRVRISPPSGYSTRLLVHDVEQEVQAEPSHHRMQIRRSDLEKFGFTANSQDCKAILRETARREHSEGCPSMMEADMKNDPRMVAQKKREEEHVARRLEEDPGP